MEKNLIRTLLFISAYIGSNTALPRAKRHNSSYEVAQPYDLNGDGKVTESETFLGESYVGLYYFRGFDKNGDEAITRAKLRAARGQIGYEEDVLERHATSIYLLRMNFDGATLTTTTSGTSEST